ncbi:hemin uptake protein HemP [Paucibacter oligotrophus]|uniref:Hemin uptake protein HemP n=1 Tax=Roseateles oligotrophus TaxID=1769250 RepID=A0A840L6R4_9BURK|nr:hemin uptake protein HemP [Roseateles oligotrophus]MBB4842325.1 hemin uptake protein HemP [Roseateles oligotrophus]
MDAQFNPTAASTPYPSELDAPPKASLAQARSPYSTSQQTVQQACRPSASSHASLAPASSHKHEQATLPRFNSEQLLNGAREMEIEHGGSLYRLRLTALGKLILTK